jgi:hypothetical protein
VRDLEIDLASRTVTVGGEAVQLSAKEYELLVALAGNPERVFKKEELLRDVWSFRSLGRTRTLDSHASRLRRKLNRALETRLHPQRVGSGLPAGGHCRLGDRPRRRFVAALGRPALDVVDLRRLVVVMERGPLDVDREEVPVVRRAIAACFLDRAGDRAP